jgi:hypothetical protein
MKRRASVSPDFALAAVIGQAGPRRQNPIGCRLGYWGRSPGLAALLLQGKARQGYFQSWSGRPVRAEAQGRGVGHENTGKGSGNSAHARGYERCWALAFRRVGPTERGFSSRPAG